MCNMKVNIAGVEFANPVMTASGTFGSGMEYSDFVDLSRLGAVVTKGRGECAVAGKSNAPHRRDTRRHDECDRSAKSGGRYVL